MPTHLSLETVIVYDAGSELAILQYTFSTGRVVPCAVESRVQPAGSVIVAERVAPPPTNISIKSPLTTPVGTLSVIWIAETSSALVVGVPRRAIELIGFPVLPTKLRVKFSFAVLLRKSPPEAE